MRTVLGENWPAVLTARFVGELEQKERNLSCESKFFQKRKPLKNEQSSRGSCRMDSARFIENIGLEQSFCLILATGILDYQS